MQQIIACIDQSRCSGSVQPAAVWAASQLQVPLVFLHIIEKQSLADSQSLSKGIGFAARSQLLQELSSLEQEHAGAALQQGKALLDAAKVQALESGCSEVEAIQRHGDFVETITELTENTPLLILGHCDSQEHEINPVLGSHIENLLRRVHAPTLISMPGFAVPHSFMLAYDVRDTEDLVLQEVLESKLLQGLHCHLVTVKSRQEQQQERLENAARRLLAAGFAVTSACLEGTVSEELLAYQQKHQVELMVMGAFASGALRKFFLGSNTIKVLEQSQIPVLVLR